jgi:hypothetical protein
MSMLALSKIDDIRRSLNIAIATVGDHLETEALADALSLALQEANKLKAPPARTGMRDPVGSLQSGR